jgi:serine/threonine protein kinase
MKTEVWKSKWRKLEHIGSGGQGRTYKVSRIDLPDDHTVYVLKELVRQNDVERRARMFQEVEHLRKLNHPRIAKLIESNAHRYTEDEELYLVMEYIPGPHLRDFTS